MIRMRKSRNLPRTNCPFDRAFERNFGQETASVGQLVRGPLSAGFTLIELMIVVVILGLLATLIVPRILNRPEQARRVKAAVDIRNIESALALFKTDTGRFPTTSEGLEALVSNPGIKGYNDDGYLDKAPVDPWGNKYIYISPGVHSRDYDLESYGKDGEDGGTGDSADIESWNLEG